jgi:hypothetical protein
VFPAPGRIIANPEAQETTIRMDAELESLHRHHALIP